MIVFCFQNSAYAKECNDNSHEPYMEEITITFENDETKPFISNDAKIMKDIKILNYLKQSMNQIEAQGFDVETDAVKSALSDLIPAEGELIALSMKNVYCEEGFSEGEYFSKLLTKNEVEAIRRDTAVKPMSIIGNYYDSRGKLTFITAVSTTNVSGRELAYLVASTATWDAMGSSGELYPAPGKDAICVSWGGNFYHENSNMSITSFAGQSIPYEAVGYEPNAGYGWAFEDAMTTSGSSSCMKKAVSRITLTKNHASDELTEIFATYVHTYKKLTWSFSVGFSGGSELSGGVSITPSTSPEYWHIVLRIPNISY